MSSIFKTVAAAAALFAVILLVGCGGDDDDSESSAAAGDDSAAVEDTVKSWLLEGGCDRMTDKFLEEQTFITDPAEACQTFESGFAAPSYGEEDIVVSDVEVDGETATLVVSDDFSGIESRYELVNEDGAWKIDAAELL